MAKYYEIPCSFRNLLHVCTFAASQCRRLLSGSGSSVSVLGGYDSNADCTWTIVAEVGSRVQLSFSAFDTERTQDVVTIMVNSDLNAVEIFMFF